MYTRLIKICLFCFPLFLAACSDDSQSPSHLAQYLENAEFQCETDEQKENIHQVFHDMLTLSPDELKGKIYKNYQGVPAWPAHVVIEKHFVPGVKVFLDKDTFYEELRNPETQKVLYQWLKKME